MQAVILAAGESSRFFPFLKDTHKSTISVCGKPLISWTLEALASAEIKEAVVVISPRDDRMRKFLGQIKKPKIQIIEQPKPLGMGNALLSAKKLLSEKFIVLFPYMVNADKLIKPLTKRTLSDAALLVDKTKEPWRYGIITLKGTRAVSIVEKPAKGREPSNIKAAGVYLLTREYIEILESTPVEDFQFETALAEFMKKRRVKAVWANESVMTLKYPWDLLKIKDYLLEVLPAKKAKSAKIAKTATVQGKVIIEEDARVYDYALIQGPVYIGRSAVVGAYSILRDYSSLEEKAEIQRFVDCTRSIIGPDSQVHTGFVGDSILGSGVRVGAGFVSANRRIDRNEVEVEAQGERISTRKSYMGAFIGDGVNMGVNVTLMPGVVVGSGAIIGPDSAVMENVPPDTLFYTDYKKSAVKKRIK